MDCMKVPLRFQAYLKRLISHFKNGVDLNDFLRHFEELSTAPLEYKQYGFISPQSMITALENVFRIEYHGSTPWVYPAESQPAPGQPNVQSIPVETENGASTTKSPYQMTRCVLW